MKIIRVVHESKPVEKVIDIGRFVTVPGWVWPFQCDWCHYDIDKDETQVVVELPSNDVVGHYHLKCWNNVQAKGGAE